MSMITIANVIVPYFFHQTKAAFLLLIPIILVETLLEKSLSLS